MNIGKCKEMSILNTNFNSEHCPGTSYETICCCGFVQKFGAKLPGKILFMNTRLSDGMAEASEERIASSTQSWESEKQRRKPIVAFLPKGSNRKRGDGY